MGRPEDHADLEMRRHVSNLLSQTVGQAAEELATLTGRKLIVELRVFYAGEVLAEADAETAEYLDEPLASRKAPSVETHADRMFALGVKLGRLSMQTVEEYAPAAVDDTNVIPIDVAKGQ